MNFSRIFAGLALLGLVFPALPSVRAFDNDGETDVVWHNVSTWQNQVHFLQKMWQKNDLRLKGTGSINSAGPGWTLVTTADFNRDGQTDLLFRNKSNGQMVVWFMNGTTILANPAAGPMASGDVNFNVIGTGDFNGDGYADLLWRHKTALQTAVWYLGAPLGTNLLSAAYLPQDPGLPEWQPAAVADCNNDTHADIIWRNLVTGQNAIWFMDGITLPWGGGQLINTVQPPSGGYSLVSAGAFNPVGNTDLLWRHTSGANAAWLMTGTIFHRGTTLPAVTDTNWVVGGLGGYNPGGDIPNMMLSVPSHTSSSITLAWRYSSGLPSTIERKLPQDANWTTLASNYLPWRYTNTSIVEGQRYEYRVNGGYLLAASKATPVHNRGTILVIVETNLATQIGPHLNTLTNDLIGDGWKVILKTDALRQHDSYTALPQAMLDAINNSNKVNVAAVRSFITSNYNADPVNTKAVFIVGHVAIPYGGYSDPDGHGFRALPADSYYADINGSYSDTALHDVDARVDGINEPRWNNVIGDGKFDHPTNWVPKVELAVGRIDFANMSPTFPESETDLIRRYITKAHNYRFKVVSASNRLITGAWFTEATFNPTGILHYRSTYGRPVKVSSALFGTAPGNIIDHDALTTSNSALWGFHNGFGIPAGVRGTNGLWHTSTDMADASKEPPVMFFALHGSHLMDWDYQNSMTRGIAGVRNYGLAVAWHNPLVEQAAYESMGLGETIGAGWVKGFNDTSGTHYPTKNIHLVIIGDPTLRSQVVAPPSNLQGNNSGTYVLLTWTASPESNQYFIYRSDNGKTGPWTQLNTHTYTGTSFTNSPAPSGTSKIYQVRAAKLTTTGSGSYTNLSQGIFN